jgi:hypothetical protein
MDEGTAVQKKAYLTGRMGIQSAHMVLENSDQREESGMGAGSDQRSGVDLCGITQLVNREGEEFDSRQPVQGPVRGTVRVSGRVRDSGRYQVSGKARVSVRSRHQVWSGPRAGAELGLAR